MASKLFSKPSLNDNVEPYINMSSFHALMNEITHIISTIFRKYTNISLQNITILQWIILFVFIWIILHILLIKLTEKFLKRVGVNEHRSKLLCKTIWDLCFFSMSSYMIVEHLSLDVVKFATNTLIIIDKKTNECFLMDNNKVANSEVLFVIITAYFIHSASWTLYTQGFRNVEFLQKELITLFFILTRSLRCTEYGMMLLFFLHSHHIFEELTKLLYILGLICSSNVLRNASKCVFSIHILYWGRQFLYLCPQLLLLLSSRKINSSMVRAELNLLMLLPATVALYYLIMLYSSSVNRLLWHYLKTSGMCPISLEYILFGSTEKDTKTCSGKQASKKEKQSRRNKK
uniref:TLC domain-containing protein n=2 Tax=Clastoptera arizonana TaxID=38151 RepID=A0A1B6CFS6_9HEMI